MGRVESDGNEAHRGVFHRGRHETPHTYTHNGGHTNIVDPPRAPREGAIYAIRTDRHTGELIIFLARSFGVGENPVNKNIISCHFTRIILGISARMCSLLAAAEAGKRICPLPIS